MAVLIAEHFAYNSLTAIRREEPRMSFADVLAAARELTADEQQKLARELTEPERESDSDMLRRLYPPGNTFEVWSPFEAHGAAFVLQRLLDVAKVADAAGIELDPSTIDFPEHLRHLLPPPGTVMPCGKPELTAEGWEQVRLALAELDAARSTHSHPDSQ